MLRDFFASPNFLALLRFWDGARAGRAVPDWNGDLEAIPAELLPRTIIVERGEALIYRYLGVWNRQQFGRDPTGATVAETLSPEYAAYLTDLTDATLAGGEPVFSCSVLRRHSQIKRTGRLVTPFTFRGSARPSLIMSAHLEAGDEFRVTEVLEPGGILETERVRIASAPAVCDRLKEVGRYHRLSKSVLDQSLAAEWDRIAASLGAEVIVPLKRFGDPASTSEQRYG